MKNIHSLSSLVWLVAALMASPSASVALETSSNNGHLLSSDNTTIATNSDDNRSCRSSPQCVVDPPGHDRATHAANANANANAKAAPTAVQRRDVEVSLPGLFGENSKSVYLLDDFAWAIKAGVSIPDRIRGCLGFLFGGGLIEYAKFLWVIFGRRAASATIYDARAREAEEGLSKAEFFEKYGFVLLEHTTAMTEEDWEASDRDVAGTLTAFNLRSEDGGASYNDMLDRFRNADTPVRRIYSEEIVELISAVLPRAKTIMPPSEGIRRRIEGGGIHKSPAKLVHNDYGLVFDEVADRNPFFDFDKQKKIYEESGSDEYLLVNLWRPIAPMSATGKLRSFPLCFLDASTVSGDDFVSSDSQSFGVATHLKENEKHRFYYYPDMTVNEVILFKQFHQVRNESLARMPVFHTAFPDPAWDAKHDEGRVSFEYRVGLLA